MGIPHLLIGSDFLGPDYLVSNVQYTGSLNAIGSFDGTNANVGISAGIVMTTGTILTNDGPKGPNNAPNAALDNGQPGHSVLTAVAGGNQSYNAAVLEFDFLAYSDTISLKYVFGSEEYPEYAPPNNSNFNDVFVILISGPGISGAQNIARLSNGQNVSINNVNPATNSLLYNSNGDGFQSPYNSDPYYIQYDGFTTVLAAKSNLQIGETYHLLIGIADVGDVIYDSGIFISSCETCSFNASLDDKLTSSPILYPNPVSDQLFIKSKELSQSIQIIDLYGKIIEEFDTNESIKVSNLQNGTYFLKFTSKGVERIEKFTVIHD